MIHCDCKYYDGDEDRNWCSKRGYFYGGCDHCEDYNDNFKTTKESEEEV